MQLSSDPEDLDELVLCLIRSETLQEFSAEKSWSRCCVSQVLLELVVYQRAPQMSDCSAMLHVLGSRSAAAPEVPADYCTGTRTQSAFIRKRSKIIQERYGPLIHLKRQMRGMGEPRVILKEENPEEQP